MPTGIVYLIGTGPGDPELLTLKGQRCLAEADVIMYDPPMDQRLLAYARPEAELIDAGGKSGGDALSQAEINRLMIERACGGQVVARLKSDDPFLFGRGDEEAEVLAAAQVPFEIVPGIPSALAVPTYAGIPVSQSNSSAVVVVQGQGKVWEDVSPLHWAPVVSGRSTLVILIDAHQLHDTMEQLITHGLPTDTPIALIRWGTRPDQEVLTGTAGTIAELAAERGFEPPVVGVVGEVVRLRERFRWFDTKPLFGRRIVVTRPRAQAHEFVELLERQGAEVLQFPTIETVPLASYAQLDQALDTLSAYHWLIFTSVNGVQYFFARLRARQQDIRSLDNVRIAAIGPATARAVEALHLRVDAMPEEYWAEALVTIVGDVGGQRILLPRAAEAREILPRELHALGAQVDEIAVYQTVLPQAAKAEQLRSLLEARKIDLVTFTSSSTVRNFVAVFPADAVQTLLRKTRIGCIGPITADTARAYGLEVALQPTTYTIPAFAAAIVEYFRNQQLASGGQ